MFQFLLQIPDIKYVRLENEYSQFQVDELYESDEDDVDLLPEVKMVMCERQDDSKEVIGSTQDPNSPDIITIDHSEDERDVEESIIKSVIAESLIGGGLIVLSLVTHSIVNQEGWV